MKWKLSRCYNGTGGELRHLILNANCHPFNLGRGWCCDVTLARAHWNRLYQKKIWISFRYTPCCIDQKKRPRKPWEDSVLSDAVKARLRSFKKNAQIRRTVSDLIKRDVSVEGVLTSVRRLHCGMNLFCYFSTFVYSLVILGYKWTTETIWTDLKLSSSVKDGRYGRLTCQLLRAWGHKGV